MLTPEQVSERTAYLGGSDAAAVLGLSRWSSPLTVWAIKTGQIVSEDKSDQLAIQVGNELEDAVCRLFTKRTGKKVARVNETIFHPKHPFLGANIDRRIVGEDSVLEAKTASGWKAKEWTGEDIPIEYRLKKDTKGWFVYDVSIEGVSLVNNYRTQFNSIITQSSYENFVKVLKAKVAEK